MLKAVHWFVLLIMRKNTCSNKFKKGILTFEDTIQTTVEIEINEK